MLSSLSLKQIWNVKKISQNDFTSTSHAVNLVLKYPHFRISLIQTNSLKMC